MGHKGKKWGLVFELEAVELVDVPAAQLCHFMFGNEQILGGEILDRINKPIGLNCLTDNSLGFVGITSNF